MVTSPLLKIQRRPFLRYQKWDHKDFLPRLAPSSAHLPPGQLEPDDTQQQEPVRINSTPLESAPQSGLQSYPHHGIQMGGVPPQFLMQMMETMQKMSERLGASPTEAKTRIQDIYLLSFDPDTHVGVREWCQHIDRAIKAYKLNSFAVRMKVCSLLKGRAKMWIDDWMVTTTTWEELRRNLITTFEPENRYSRDIIMFREHVYDSTQDIAEFLSRAWILWKRVTKDKLGDELAVEAVIGSINDERLSNYLMPGLPRSLSLSQLRNPYGKSEVTQAPV